MNIVLLVIHLFLAIFLVGVILIQRNNSDGLGGLSGSGSGGGNAFMSGRATANLLTRATAILAALFMLNSLVLANLASRNNTQKSIVDQAEDAAKTGKDTAKGAEKPAAKPVVPSVPVAE